MPAISSDKTTGRFAVVDGGMQGIFRQRSCERARYSAPVDTIYPVDSGHALLNLDNDSISHLKALVVVAADGHALDAASLAPGGHHQPLGAQDAGHAKFADHGSGFPRRRRGIEFAVNK